MATATNYATAGTDPNAPPDDAINPANVGKAPAAPALPTAAPVAPAAPASGPADAQNPSNLSGGSIGASTPPVSPPVAPATPATLPTATAVSPTDTTGNTVSTSALNGLTPSDPANVGVTPIPDFTGQNPTGMVGDAGTPVQPAALPTATATDTSGSITPTSGITAGVGEGAPPTQSLSDALAQAAGNSPTGNTATPLSSATAGPTAGANAPVTQTPTDPNNPLTAQTLSVGALNDPLQMAISQYQTAANASEPQYQADLRDALRSAAAGGAIGSGALNTSLGNITDQRQNTLATTQQNLLQNALTQQNSNAYANEGIAAQQQGFQNGQEQQGFQNDLSTTQEQSALNSTAFGQALSQLTAGEQNNPAAMEATVAQIFGGDAAAAEAALAGLTKSSATNSTTAASNQQLINAMNQYIASLTKGSTPNTTPTTTTPQNGGTNGWTQNADGSYTDPSGNSWTQDSGGNWNEVG